MRNKEGKKRIGMQGKKGKNRREEGMGNEWEGAGKRYLNRQIGKRKEVKGMGGGGRELIQKIR